MMGAMRASTEWRFWVEGRLDQLLGWHLQARSFIAQHQGHSSCLAVKQKKKKSTFPTVNTPIFSHWWTPLVELSRQQSMIDVFCFVVHAVTAFSNEPKELWKFTIWPSGFNHDSWGNGSGVKLDSNMASIKECRIFTGWIHCTWCCRLTSLTCDESQIKTNRDSPFYSILIYIK